MNLPNPKSSSPDFAIDQIWSYKAIHPSQEYFLYHFTLPRSTRLNHLVISKIHLSIEIQYSFWHFID